MAVNSDNQHSLLFLIKPNSYSPCVPALPITAAAVGQRFALPKTFNTAVLKQENGTKWRLLFPRAQASVFKSFIVIIRLTENIWHFCLK